MRLASGRFALVTEEPNPRIQQRYSATELSRLDQHPSNETTFGLTSARSQAAVHIELHGIGIPGGVCVRPDVQMRLGYSEMRVDLARELEPNTCLYNEILGHEMRHVGAYRTYLPEAKSRLAAALNERLPAPRVLRFASMQEAGKYFEDLQDNWLSPLAVSTLDGVKEAQSAIDTPEEYARLSNACHQGSSGLHANPP